MIMKLLLLQLLPVQKACAYAQNASVLTLTLFVTEFENIESVVEKTSWAATKSGIRTEKSFWERTSKTDRLPPIWLVSVPSSTHLLPWVGRAYVRRPKGPVAPVDPVLPVAPATPEGPVGPAITDGLTPLLVDLAVRDVPSCTHVSLELVVAV